MTLLALLGCPRPVPDHLRLDPVQQADLAPEVPITDVASAVARMVGKDPLARSPNLPDANTLDELAGGEPLAAFVRAVRAAEVDSAPVERTLQALEDEWRGTVAVPFARGYRLRVAENALANGASDDEQVQQQLVLLLTPLGAAIADPTLPRLPLAWLGDGSARGYGERWVLESWLSAPQIPVAVLAAPLTAPQYDPLRASPIGQLVVARAAAPHADAEAAFADLSRATQLAVERAAADRDAEQAAWAERKKALVAELGDPDPVGFLLERAVRGLTADAGSDRSAGGALLGLAALRWIGRCGEPGCAGVDRVETMAAAARWDPAVAPLAEAWEVVALKEAIDSVEVGRDTVMFPEAAVELVDALVGTDAGVIEAPVLRKAHPDGQVWLALSRAVGDDGATDWEGTRVALGRHLATRTARALEHASDPAIREGLERVARRAIP